MSDRSGTIEQSTAGQQSCGGRLPSRSLPGGCESTDDQIYKSVFQHAPVGMALLDRDGCIVEANLALSQMLGYSVRELVGRAFSAIVSADDLSAPDYLCRDLLTGRRRDFSAEGRCFRKDGRTFGACLFFSVLPVPADSDRVAVGVITDVSAQSHTAEQLRTVTRALRTLSECNQTLLRVGKEPDLLSEVCRIIVEVGGYRMAWVGYAQDDSAKRIVPQAYAGMEDGFLAGLDLTWADRKQGRGPTGTAIREMTPQIVSQLAHDRNVGFWRKAALRRRYESAIALPLNLGDQTVGALTIYSDSPNAFDRTEEVTLLNKLADNLAYGIMTLRIRAEREQAEEEKQSMRTQLMQSQKMEALGRLAGGIAHDFNNLLTEIIGYSELLLATLDENDQNLADIEMIKSAGERAGVLTKQLLAFSRRQVVRPKLLKINDIVGDMQQMLRRLIGEDIESITYLDPDVECIRADRSQIEQVILNLVVNARHAMPRGGKLTIGTEFVILDAYDCKLMPEARPGRFVCLTIGDTGVGIESDMLERIFDPFFSTKGPTQGSGLGLSVVYGIVAQHDGWIRVSSTIDEGTRFKVYLPLYTGEAEVERCEKIPLHRLRGNGERILLVEDEDGVRRLAADAFQRAGYTVFAAASAKEALELFNRECGNFELLVSDVVLPDLSGTELTEQFRARAPSLAVLLTSGHTFEDPQIDAMVSAGLPFLQKPFTVPALLQRVKAVLAAKTG